MLSAACNHVTHAHIALAAQGSLHCNPVIGCISTGALVQAISILITVHFNKADPISVS